MKATKATLLLTILAVAPVLLGAEPNSSTPDQRPSMTPSASEDLADQAALVQQIGEEAARGFDPEAHAHALRVQIESLISTPTTAKASVTAEAVPLASSSRTIVKLPATPPPTVWPAAAPRPETAIHQAIQKLKAALQELETQLSGQ